MVSVDEENVIYAISVLIPPTNNNEVIFDPIIILSGRSTSQRNAAEILMISSGTAAHTASNAIPSNVPETLVV